MILTKLQLWGAGLMLAAALGALGYFSIRTVYLKHQLDVVTLARDDATQRLEVAREERTKAADSALEWEKSFWDLYNNHAEMLRRFELSQAKARAALEQAHAERQRLADERAEWQAVYDAARGDAECRALLDLPLCPSLQEAE